MEEKRKKRDRNYYLTGGADILSRRVYEMVKKQAKNKDDDPKSIKELCALLKETVNIALSLEKTDGGEKDTLLITFDGDILDLSE